jgi:RecA/RadA recombinase
MNYDIFNELVRERLQKTSDILITKGKEYIRNENPLHNFEVGAIIANKTPQNTLDGMMLKHYISYRDMLDDVQNDKKIKKEKIKEMFGDLIVYFILQEIQMLNYENDYSNN